MIECVAAFVFPQRSSTPVGDWLWVFAFILIIGHRYLASWCAGNSATFCHEACHFEFRLVARSLLAMGSYLWTRGLYSAELIPLLNRCRPLCVDELG
jgi:hypothetical protein